MKTSLLTRPAVVGDLLMGLVEDPLATVEASRARVDRVELERRTCAAFERGVFGSDRIAVLGTDARIRTHATEDGLISPADRFDPFIRTTACACAHEDLQRVH